MENWQDTLKMVAKATNEIHDVTKDIRKALKKKEAQDAEISKDKKGNAGENAVLNVLTAVGVATAAVGIGYALYRYFMPDYLNEYSDDDYKDDFDEYFEDEDAAVKTPAENSETAEKAAPGESDVAAEALSEESEAETGNDGDELEKSGAAENTDDGTDS